MSGNRIGRRSRPMVSGDIISDESVDTTYHARGGIVSMRPYSTYATASMQIDPIVERQHASLVSGFQPITSIQRSIGGWQIISKNKEEDSIAATRIGKFQISSHIVKSSVFTMARVFQEMSFIPTNVNMCLSNNKYQYEGISPQFDIVKKGDLIPEYKVEFTDTNNMLQVCVTKIVSDNKINDNENIVIDSSIVEEPKRRLVL